MGCVDFRKHLQFRKDFLLQVGSKLTGFAVVVPLAFLTRSYWALVAGAIAGRAGGLAMSYALHPFRPRLSLRGTRDLFGFSAWMMMNNAVNYLRLRGAHLVIGRLMSSQSLGLYTISFEMANLPSSELATPINRAIFPGYSKLQDDRPAMQRAFLRVLGLVALGTIPAGIGMAGVAHLFVPAVLGAKWNETVPLISLLAIGGTIYVLQVNIQSLYYATGRPNLKGLMTLVEIAVLLPLLMLLIPRYQLTGAAVAMLVTVSLSVPLNFGIALRMLDLSPRAVIAVVWRPIVAASAMFFAIRAVFPPSSAAGSSLDNLWLLLAAALLGAAVYAITVAALWLFSGRPAGAEAWVWLQLQRLDQRCRRSAKD
jgi:O-antigen/teichoic acid export membrane protein